MGLVTTKEMFQKAYEGGYAIGAFNVIIWKLFRESQRRQARFVRL